jgi:hypothetical protein
MAMALVRDAWCCGVCWQRYGRGITGFADTAQTRQNHIAQNYDVIGNSWDKPRDV